ncbi:hypothetical protein [Streptomyces odontomachi]|uniref:hypothetical protein n=1 Tax=Streptomyces odontomachi TaxID=2944940 RepID=UPI00210D9755|nr:hypothetical protein [Streptomyces sp. ODS25]
MVELTGEPNRYSVWVGGNNVGQVAGRDIRNENGAAEEEMRQIRAKLEDLLGEVRRGAFGAEAAEEVAPVLEEARASATGGDLVQAESRLVVAADRARFFAALAPAITAILEPVRSLIQR